VVSDINPKASEIFNPTNPNNNDPSATTGKDVAVGYLVDTDGDILFPMLGSIRAQGLTKSQLKNKIRNIILEKKLLLEPIVSIRFLNFRVTVLGEVGHPTVIPIPNEKISLLEALGLAGDLTIYGKRTNVMIIREEKDQKITKHVNLNSSELFSSPYYYLKSNDVVYVEPNKNRVTGSSRTLIWAPVIVSVISLGIIIASRL